jgi:hypothetical protein
MRSLTIIATLALAFAGACGNNNNTPKDAPPMIDASVGGPDASCFVLGSNATNTEIINACTTAQKIYLNPTLPLLVDGGLPALP